ncbi:RNA uridylyltransferase [Aureococcus anophagefferens]|nr:RNA uridylyltransferase [Aureococcus anophagefferens]
MWPKLFAEARANGLNAIESYAFWNKHSATRDGAYDYGFNGDAWIRRARHAERTNNTAWLNETGRWMRDHFAVIEPHLSRNGASAASHSRPRRDPPDVSRRPDHRVADRERVRRSRSDAAAVAYVDALDALADAVAPELVWMMCGFVSLVAPARSTNGCDQGGARPHAYFLKFANDTASVVFGVHACAQWNACDANATAAVDVRASNATGLFPAGAPPALVLPFGSVVALDGASGAVLFNTSDVAPVDAPAIACGPALAWTNWTDGDGRGWFAADFPSARRRRGDAGQAALRVAQVAGVCGRRPGGQRAGRRGLRRAVPRYHAYPEAADAKTILIAVPPGEAARTVQVRVCAALGATS